MKEFKVVTNFLLHNNKLLLLQRSARVGSYQGRWAGVSGFIEGERTAVEQGLIEICEETSIPADNLTLAKCGEVVVIEDRELDTRWLVHPVKWMVASLEGFRLDWEHTRLQWIDPEEMRELQTVPGLYDAWERVR